MKQNQENGKFILENQLRTWSDLKRRNAGAAASNGTNGAAPAITGPPHPPYSDSPTIAARQWGGCASGCDHDKISFPRRTRRQNTADLDKLAALPGPAVVEPQSELADNPVGAHEREGVHVSSDVEDTPTSSDADSAKQKSAHHALLRMHPGRDFGGSRSGAGTPAEGFSDDSDYFSTRLLKGSTHRERSKARRRNEKTWKEESGMGAGARADALGDGDSGDEAGDDDDGEADLTGGDVLTEEEREEEVEDAKLKSRKGFGEVY